MSKANLDLREYSNKKSVPQWKIAKFFGVADGAYLIKDNLEKIEFSKEKKAKYREIVDSIAAEEA